MRCDLDEPAYSDQSHGVQRLSVLAEGNARLRSVDADARELHPPPQQSRNQQRLCLTSPRTWFHMSCIACNPFQDETQECSDALSREKTDSQ